MSDMASVESGQPVVLLVTRNLPPLRGGMERLNQHIAMELAEAFRIVVVGPQGCRSQLPRNIDVYEVPTRPLWRFLWSAFVVAMRQSKRRRPKIVMAGSGLTAPIAVITAFFVRARSVVYAHGLDLVTPHVVYRLLWLPFLRVSDVCLVNSRNTARLANVAGIKSQRTSIIHPGVALPSLSSADPARAQSFRRMHGLERHKILLSVGRLTARKGLLEFVRYALPEIVKASPNAVLVVIGDEAPDALQGRGEGTSTHLISCASEMGLQQNLRLLGARDEAELESAYESADLCIFPVIERSGDVEGFGMVAIEAAAHGLCTIAFNVGGVGDAVVDGRSGALIEAGDYSGFAQRTIEMLGAGRSEQMRQSCVQFASEFEWPKFGARLRHCFVQLMTEDMVPHE